jgi:hypothetical protein
MRMAELTAMRQEREKELREKEEKLLNWEDRMKAEE